MVCVKADRKAKYASGALKEKIGARASTPYGVFYTQRATAAIRGVVWKLSFGQWWGIWQASGRWPERGVHRGEYVMARHGDIGPYEVGNVKIITAEENVRESHETRIKILPTERHPNASELLGDVR